MGVYVEKDTCMRPLVDHILAQLSGATISSKLDANSGFWQIQSTEESRKLSTFITPFADTIGLLQHQSTVSDLRRSRWCGMYDGHSYNLHTIT